MDQTTGGYEPLGLPATSDDQPEPVHDLEPSIEPLNGHVETTTPTPPTTNRYRPYTPFTDEMKATFLQYLDQGFSLAGAALKAGSNYATIWYNRKIDPEFDAAINEAYEVGTDHFEDLMLVKAERPEGFLANIASLKARRREKWGDRVTLDIEGRVRQLAEQMGLNPDEVVVEAQKLLGPGKAR